MSRASLRRILNRYVELPAARVLARLGVSPDGLTVAGLLVAGLAAYLVAAGSPLWGGLVLLASGLFDLLDGALARATGRVTPFGGFLDSTVDRLSEAVVLLGVLLRFALEGSLWGVALAYAALVGSFTVSYMRARAEGLGLRCDVGVLTRPERLLLLSLALVITPWLSSALVAALVVMAVLTFLTSLQRLLHVRRQVRRGGESR